MQIQSFDRPTLRTLGAEIEVALREVAKRHGLHLTMKGGRFDATTYTPKFEFATISQGGNAETREASAFKQWAKAFGLEPSDLNATIQHKGHKYKIVGANPNAKRMPILLTRSDGRGVKMGADYVRFLLGRHPSGVVIPKEPPFTP